MKKKKLNTKLGKALDLANIYYDDGAPRTALNILLKARREAPREQKYLLSPNIKMCRNEIARKNYHFRKHGLKTI